MRNIMIAMIAMIMAMAKMITKIMLMTKIMMVMQEQWGGDALKSAPIKAKGILSVLSFLIIITTTLIIIILSW